MTTPNQISEWPPERIAEVLEYCEKWSTGWSPIEQFTKFSHKAIRTDLPSAVREIQRLQKEVAFKMGPAGPLEMLWQITEKFQRGLPDFKDGEKGGLTDLGALRIALDVVRHVLDAAKDPAK